MTRTRLSRRKFLAASGAAAAAWPAEAGEAKPDDLIDCQSHLFVPELLAYMAKRKKPP